MPSIRKLYWDTYQSWVDVLPEKYASVQLFNGHPRGLPSSICNYPGAGQLPSDQSAEIIGVGAQIHASDSHINEIVRAASTFSVFIGDKEYFRMHMAMAEEHLSDEAREAEVIEIPEGFLQMGDKPLVVAPRNRLFGELHFNKTAETLLRKIGTRIGPGAGWVSIIAYLIMDVKSPAH